MTPNCDASLAGDRDRRDGDAGADLEVVLDHLARVHVVDVIGAEHADDVGALVADEVEVLVDRVGRAAEPVRAATHLRRHRRHVVAEQRGEPPRLADVAVEAVALVLREHDDLQVAGVGEVRQDEVDDPVAAAVGHGRLGPVGSQRRQPPALTAGQDDDENLRLSHSARYVRTPCRRPARRYNSTCCGRRLLPRPVDGHAAALHRGASARLRVRLAPCGAAPSINATELALRHHDAGAARRRVVDVDDGVVQPADVGDQRASCRSASTASAPGRTARSGSASRTRRHRRRAGGPAPRRSHARTQPDADARPPPQLSASASP